METNHKLGLVTRKFLYDPRQYQRVVGRLIYLILTHPKLIYLVHILSQFMQAPWEDHMEATRRVVRYIKGNLGQEILLRSDYNLEITTFCDSD